MRTPAHTNAPVIEDGRQAERIRPDPLLALAPARIMPSIEEVEQVEKAKPKSSGQRAPDFGVSENIEPDQSFEPSDDEAEPDNLVMFPTPETASRRGRKALEERYRMDYVKASRNTWAFRIRPRDDSFPPVVIRRVDEQTFKQITRSKKRYAKFQATQINQFKQRAVCADFGRLADADCSL